MFVPWKLSLWLHKVLPGFLLRPLKAIYTVYHARLMRRMEREVEELVPRIFPTLPATVLDGPFKGLTYVSRSVGSAFAPKLIGSYEAELNDIIERVIQRGYAKVINIGCAEGYFAVGLARRMPQTTVYAYDLSDTAIRLCRELAAQNQVGDRVRVNGACTHQILNELCDEDTLVLSDCEGAEVDLLDPVKAPSLARSDMLVELHGSSDPTAYITKTILARFEPTHHATLIATQERDPNAYPVLARFTPHERWLAVNEFRAGTREWVFLERRKPAPAA